MAWLQVYALGIVTSVVCASLAVSQESQSPAHIVGKETHVRQKRHWIWNSLYVEEEKPVDVAFKIGQLKSSQKVEAMKFKIEGEGANTIFTVDQKGDLFVTRALDREEKNLYHLTAWMYDGNNRLIEDSGDFVVQVTDLNDNSPVFPKAYNGSIVERSMIGAEVVQVTATDADDPSTANGEIRYSLTESEDNAAFEIDSITGDITCKSNTLDRETKSQYVLVVKAQDMRGMASGSSATTTVPITITDTNDNIASFTRRTYEFHVPENHKLYKNIGTLELEDRDEFENKEPVFSVPTENSRVFGIELDDNKNGNLTLQQGLDFETTSSYAFKVQVRENLRNMRFPPDNVKTAVTTAQVTIRVLDVDEPPVFSQPIYTFSVPEEMMVNNVGSVTAIDPDRTKKSIRYSILDMDGLMGINPFTGQLFTLKKLDREQKATHVFQVKAQEEPSGLESFVKVNIIVHDVNDNEPELLVDEIFVCESDAPHTVLGTLRATDKDDRPASFTFSLASESSNFTIRDHGNSTADVLVKQGPFSLDDPKDHSVEVRVSDGGQPLQFSVTRLAIKLCRCNGRRIPTQCKAGARRTGVSVHALIAILLCILTILVIVILFVMRKRYRKDSLAHMKNSGEIHEQLVTYDEEGGGEMDTNGYDVSILSSACQDGSLLRRPDHPPHPSLYAMVQKPPQHSQPAACKGDMAAMIEVKKDEADHDRDGYPYDTLHIYGYEGPESLAGSLSSLGSSSIASNLDYDFLNDWGPRFRTLAELYGVDEPEYYHQY